MFFFFIQFAAVLSPRDYSNSSEATARWRRSSSYTHWYAERQFMPTLSPQHWPLCVFMVFIYIDNRVREYERQRMRWNQVTEERRMNLLFWFYIQFEYICFVVVLWSIDSLRAVKLFELTQLPTTFTCSIHYCGLAFNKIWLEVLTERAKFIDPQAKYNNHRFQLICQMNDCKWANFKQFSYLKKKKT